MKELNKFVFFPSFLECVENAPIEERGNVVYAIVKYGITGKLPSNLPQSFKMIFPAIKPIIDSTIKKYNAQIENGKKGGRPKTKSSLEKPKQNPNESQLKPNNNQIESQLPTNGKPNTNLNKEKDKEKKKEIDIDKNNNNIKEINKESIVDDVVNCLNEKRKFYYDCLIEKLNKLSNILDPIKLNKLEKLFMEVYNKNSFVIANENISSGDVLEKFVNLFAGTNEEICFRFNEVFNSIDSAENVNNKLKYSVSALYQYACNHC